MTDYERGALAKMVYEAVRFASWAAGEGICPIEGEPAVDPADFLCDYCTLVGANDWERLAEIARDAVMGREP